MPRKTYHPLPEPPGQLQLFESAPPTETKLPDPTPHDHSAPAAHASTQATPPAASLPAPASGTSARRAARSKAARPLTAGAKASAKKRGKRHRAHRRAAGMVRVEVEMSRAARKQLQQVARRVEKSLRRLGGEILAEAAQPAA